MHPLRKDGAFIDFPLFSFLLSPHSRSTEISDGCDLGEL